jgi:hypothetical protein
MALDSTRWTSLSSPGEIVLDMDHSEDAPHGQQEFSFCYHHYGSRAWLQSKDRIRVQLP